MKPYIRTAIITVIVLLLVILGWLVLSWGSKSTGELTDSQRSILKIQDDRLSKGSSDAPVKIVEYLDLLCPYCAEASQPGGIIPRMTEDYVDTGKAHFEVRIVAKTARDSDRAGQGAYCAAEQDQFWTYLDEAYSVTWRQFYSQGKSTEEVTTFTDSNLLNLVRSLDEIDHLTWQNCMNDNSYTEVMKDNAADMSELKAYGTPTMVIDGKNYTGTPPYPTFQAIIEASYNEKMSDENEDEDDEQ